MQLRLISLLLSLLLFQSCSESTKTYYVKVKDAKGVRVGSEVIISGLVVGEVQEALFQPDNSIKLTIELNKKIEIPGDSKFEITAPSFIGDKAVEITLGKDRAHLLQDGDVIRAKMRPPVTSSAPKGDSTHVSVNKLVDFVNLLTGRDSLLIEIRRLNDNLDKVQELLEKK